MEKSDNSTQVHPATPGRGSGTEQAATSAQDEPLFASARPRYFSHRRRVNYHETDAMGVVHHSNHIKYFEEARVAWLRARGLHEFHTPVGPYTFAVVALSNRYFSTARFDDEVEVWVQSRLVRARIHFRYALWSARLKMIIADGTTELVAINAALKPVRLPRQLTENYAYEPWDESWERARGEPQNLPDLSAAALLQSP